MYSPTKYTILHYLQCKSRCEYESRMRQFVPLLALLIVVGFTESFSFNIEPFIRKLPSLKFISKENSLVVKSYKELTYLFCNDLKLK